MNALSLALVPDCISENGKYAPVIYFICDGIIHHQWVFYTGGSVDLPVEARHIAQKKIDEIKKFAYPHIAQLFVDVITERRYPIYASYEDTQSLKDGK